MGDPLEAKIVDRLRPGPDDLRRRVEVGLDLGRTGVVNAGVAETVAEDRDEEVKDEETAPGGGPRPGGKEIQPDDMAELKEDVEKIHEMIPGKLPVDWPRYSGPHWPLVETDSIEEWARLPCRIR